jgi:flagellar assembly factor FliW
MVAPTLDLLLSHGYEFAYIDSRVWEDLSPEVQNAAGLDAACIVTLAEAWDDSHVNFRRMLDLRSCP